MPGLQESLLEQAQAAKRKGFEASYGGSISQITSPVAKTVMRMVVEPTSTIRLSRQSVLALADLACNRTGRSVTMQTLRARRPKAVCLVDITG
jgi:hypothetical protein